MGVPRHHHLRLSLGSSPLASIALIVSLILGSAWGGALQAAESSPGEGPSKGNAAVPSELQPGTGSLQSLGIRYATVDDNGQFAGVIGGHGPPSSPSVPLDPEGIKLTVGDLNLAQTLDVERFGASGEGLTVLIAIDTSGTMRTSLPALKQGLIEFTSTLRPGLDAVALGSIGDDWALRQPFTTDPGTLADSLAGLEARAKTTALFESIDLGLQTLAAAPESLPARRLMVVISDGLNEKEGRSAQDCIARARALNLQVHSLIYLTSKSERYLSAKGALETISRDSGALTTTIDKPESLGNALDMVKKSLEQEISVSADLWESEVPSGERRLTVSYGGESTDIPIIVPPKPIALAPAPETETEVATNPTRVILGISTGALLILFVGLWLRRRAKPADEAPEAAEEGPAPQSISLHILAGPQIGQRIEVPIMGGSLGFDDANQMVIPDSSISSVHAQLSLGKDGSYFVADLGSTNGTFVNEDAVGSEPRAIFHGDRLRLGIVVLLWEDSRDGGLQASNGTAEPWVEESA